MARRRSLDGGVDESGGFDDGGSSDLNALLASFGGDASTKELQPDQKGGPLPGVPFKEATADEDARMIGLPVEDESGPYGDRTTGREMFDRREPTGLPQGMTVQGEQGYGSEFGGQDSFATPMQSFSPTPASGMRPNPDVTQRVSHGGAPSALFSDASGGTPMFGRMGGLTGGGRGVVGSEGGQPAPTQMMLKLLRMFGSGA